MPELRGLGQRSYILTTNDNKAAKNLLLQHGFVVADNGSSIQIDNSARQLNDFLTLLIETILNCWIFPIRGWILRQLL